VTQKAFIAMRFSDDPWRDKVYLAIREELEKANYVCIRADEIRTSGPVVDEVCRLLSEADLVVIDSSGDSHSVSYEVGYCHGVGRSSDSTLLLKDNAKLPFNYRHYRHRVYRDVRHLRRLVRDFLGLIEPIRPDALGRVYSFDFSEDATYGYIFDGAKCVFDALRDLKYSGRCECYSAERFQWGRSFVVGVMLRPNNRQPEPTNEFWKKLGQLVETYSERLSPNVTLLHSGCEFASKRAMEDSMLDCGIAEFDKGNVTQMLGIDADGSTSFIRDWLNSSEKHDPEDA